MSGPPGLLLTFYGDDFTGSTDPMAALTLAGLSGRLLEREDAERQRRLPQYRIVLGIGNETSPEPTWVVVAD
jgi:hypothetical protein